LPGGRARGHIDRDMRISQVAIWCKDLEGLRAFYERHFTARANDKYVNARKRFESYFLTFPSGGQIELMRREGIAPRADDTERIGLVHLGIEVASNAAVDQLTSQICREQGEAPFDGPRWTGDGYYESIVRDPEGNRLLIVSVERRGDPAVAALGK
jgi:lactoylglutathione lyase